MRGYHIAVVGATGAAGTELLRVLERRNFPVTSLRAIGSARSVGKSRYRLFQRRRRRFPKLCSDCLPVGRDRDR